jgi:TPR repeat protein
MFPFRFRVTVYWFGKAVAAGSAAAMNDLGALYSAGNGVPQDDAEALRLFTASARNGSAIAMANVAVVHHNGEGVPVDYVQAIRWYQLAADHGYLPAYYRLGGMCEAGEGVPADKAVALGMYRHAAESDDPVLRQKAMKAIDRLENGVDDDPRAV